VSIYPGKAIQLSIGPIVALLIAFGPIPELWAESVAEETGITSQTVQADRWSSFLPFMAEEAKKRGIELPLPLGAGTVFLGLFNRDIDVTDVRVGLNGASPQSVSRFVNLGSSSDVLNANLKLDAWLLPFLDVYLLGGYVYNESTTRANVTIPKPGPIPGSYNFTTKIKTKLRGFVGGGGMTLAGGYGDFFMVTDINYAQTDIGFDNSFRAVIATIRSGWNGRVNDHPLQLWLGAGYWETANTAEGTTDVPGVGRIKFEADQGPKYPWLYDIGGGLELTKEFQLFADVGFDFHGGYLVAVGPTYRF
jgi:hypothetical protein